MVGKGALAFILNPTSFSATTTTADPAFGIITPRSAFLKRSFEQLCQPEYADEHKKRRVLLPKLSPIQDAPTSPLSVSWVPMPTSPASETGSSSSDEDAQVCDAKSGSKKKTTSCKVDGCSSLAVSRGCCVRHGGGSRCTYPGCTNGAKLRTRCFQHGGSTICQADGCSSKAKRYGYCWSHGGGRICSADDCSKVAAQGGLCWAHGGGNRCRLEGCAKRSYQKHGYYCKSHAAHKP